MENLLGRQISSVVFAVAFFSVTVFADKATDTCCPTIRISSSSFGQQSQGLRMGVYRTVGKMNKRRVYKHLESELCCVRARVCVTTV